MNQTTPPDRFIALPGSINFRDFGGYRTEDGRQVRWRKLFRCGSLAMMTEPAHRSFADLGISVICDLRRDDEVEMSPTPGHAPFDCRQHIPIAPGSSPMLRASLEDTSQSSADRIRYMVDITREIARDHHAEYRQLFEHLLAADGAFLLHCSAGKDRTGFGAGLILTALGVPEDVVLEDYLLTNQAESLKQFMAQRMRGHYGPHVDDESIAALTGVREEYLRAALDEVVTRHGSLVGYLEEIGVDASARTELKNRLLDR